jgi:phage terminase Nu1 subunit (DNA packaging protein)
MGQPKSANSGGRLMADPVGNTLVSTSELGALIGLTSRRVLQLEAEGHIASEGRNRFRLAPAIKGFIAFKESTFEARTARAVNDRLHEAKAEAIEIENARKANALVASARAEIDTIIDQVLGPLKSDLYSIPARVTADTNVRLRIENEIDRALTEAAKRAKKAITETADAG